MPELDEVDAAGATGDATVTDGNGRALPFPSDGDITAEEGLICDSPLE